jgi:hypothetical protein
MDLRNIGLRMEVDRIVLRYNIKMDLRDIELRMEVDGISLRSSPIGGFDINSVTPLNSTNGYFIRKEMITKENCDRTSEQHYGSRILMRNTVLR